MSLKPLFLIVFLVAAILIAGCSSSQNTPPVTPTIMTTATPNPTNAPTIVTTAIPTTILTTIVTTAAIPDPILHRWVRQYPVVTTSGVIWYGYEIKFYPEGTVIYNFGIPKMISSNIKIEAIQQYTGTWTKVGDNVYLIKVNPANVAGAPIIRQYTLVPEHEDPEYKGKIIKEHLESPEETDAIKPGSVPSGDEMFYPERAKID